MLSMTTLQTILQFIHAQNTTLSEVVLAVIRNPTLERNALAHGLVANTTNFLTALSRHGKMRDALDEWAHKYMKVQYHNSARRLTEKKNGWHFSALRATAKQFNDFRTEDMAKHMQELEPQLWDLMIFMLSGEDAAPLGSEDGDTASGEMNEDEYWVALGDDREPAPDAARPDEPPQTRRARIVQQRRCGLRVIRAAVILSLVMQTINQQCNALGAVNGGFFHASVMPDKALKALAHMGVSVSPDAINNAVRSLSQESAVSIMELGRSLTAAFAYDNFELKLHTNTPTIEKPGGDLKHLTSGDIFQLDHGVVPADLRCSQVLWATSLLNPAASATLQPRGFKDLLMLHPETPHASGLSRKGLFNSWKFVYDLTHFGPAYFRQFTSEIGRPHPVECIPVTKLRHHPARTMDVNNSTVDGNIEAIQQLCAQAGIGDPTAIYATGEETDISEYVVLFHGDLGTMERVVSALKARSIEDTPWARLQFVVFVPGLFHFKMAAADGIWRIWIKPKHARGDNTFLQYIGSLRPLETGKFSSNPTFRQMHEGIQHVGTVLRLDAWRVEVSRKLKNDITLETWAEQEKPSIGEIFALAVGLARTYVAGEVGGPRMFNLRRQGAQRDEQRENTLLLHEHLLLYEELSWAMNAGDIGRVETVLPSWIAIFKETGKHKYAHHMTKFFTDVHYVYPPRLRRAIRLNMLVNPKGKPDSFRGVDWVEEFNNLLTKDTYGGENSNYTINRIITESPNILTYRSCIANAERNYILTGLTTARGSPDMTRTFAALASRMAGELKPNEHIAGRKSNYVIPDTVAKGTETMVLLGHSTEDTDMADEGGGTGETTGTSGGVINQVNVEDIMNVDG
ncbi:uncharacterized protein C8Q71DRAFT_909496 [Rhodofomes roseus]|uniref:DUF6589 domain-containing protein n=1 Tax=Rhodofomes roseus TaxID=34475 RepID=A0ABQ8K833_9APHY|nr:uncharacterized protein C8Q71DRAFT_909496 [Rhodofomes roseus]KAH9833452.1 hypothetical protein C8Q71DRAFT_909496 [Rhodofomes roseus]